MTHISKELDRICRDWCPLIGMCSEEHECRNREKIKKLILEIAGANSENED